jgi:hypothetical protein
MRLNCPEQRKLLLFFFERFGVAQVKLAVAERVVEADVAAEGRHFRRRLRR